MSAGINPDPLLTKAEAADYLSLTPRMIDRMIQDGRLQPIKLGKFCRFPRSYLDLIIEQARKAQAS